MSENGKNLRAVTKELFHKINIPMHPNLPIIDVNVSKSQIEVGERLISLFALTALANDADQNLLKEWLKEEDLWNFLVNEEKEIFSLEPIPDAIINECSWKQESLYILAWSCGLVNALNFPDRECSLNNVFAKIPPEVQLDDFLDNLILRNKEEILLQLDFYYCLHASIVHPEIWDKPNSLKSIKFEVVIERRHALEWLCSNIKNWNNISLDT